MLIGITLTLEELEKHVDEKLTDNKMKLTELNKKHDKLQGEFSKEPRMIAGESGTIANPRFVALTEEIRAVQAEMKDLEESSKFLASKLEELEVIEDESKGRVSKEKDKITLSLNDCLRLGIEREV